MGSFSLFGRILIIVLSTFNTEQPVIKAKIQHDKPSEYYDMKDSDIANAKDATPLVVAALKICKLKGYKGIKFPKGVYHFYPTFAPEYYCTITNNDNGLKRTPFPIFDFNDFHIEGGGSDFIFHGKILPFIIERSTDVLVSNLSIDWEVPFFVQGTVIDNNPRDKSFDISVETPYLVEDKNIFLTIERENTLYEKKFGNRYAKQEKYHQRLGQNIIWDRNTKAPLYNNRKYSGFENSFFFEAAKVGEGVVRLKSKYQEVPPVGSVFISKGEYLFNRECPGFRIFQCKDLHFNNINIYHAGAMGLIAERSENITLDSFNVVLREGSQRLVTTIADATHFCNCKGLITIKNCIFENMLDDATNIHGTYARINTLLKDNQIAIETYHPHQKGYTFAEKGDSVQIIHHKTLRPKADILQVVEVEYVNERLSVLSFDRSVKDIAEKYDGIDNVSWHASAIIENNIVRNNRARGFLLSSPKKIEVRNNFISSQMAALRITGDLQLWNESGPCDSLLIEKNIFKNNIHGGNKQSVILIDPEQELNGQEGETYFSKNIIIKNNEIHTFDAPILKALSVNGLTFQDNKVIQTDDYKPFYHEAPNLEIFKCKNVILEGNSYQLLTGAFKDLTLQNDN